MTTTTFHANLKSDDRNLGVLGTKKNLGYLRDSAIMRSMTIFFGAVVRLAWGGLAVVEASLAGDTMLEESTKTASSLIMRGKVAGFRMGRVWSPASVLPDETRK